MLRNDRRGVLNPLAIPFFAVLLIALGAAGFGLWAYGQYTEQRDNNQIQTDQAVTQAEGALREQLQAEFDDQAKQPFETYTTSDIFGDVKVTYPKTWSVYIENDQTDNRELSGYIHPDVVPDIDDAEFAFALRFVVDDLSYSSVVNTYDKRIDDKLVTSSAVEVSGVQGLRLDGQISDFSNGAMVLLPIRDKTLRVWTESQQYLKDFNDVTLKNLSLNP